MEKKHTSRKHSHRRMASIAVASMLGMTFLITACEKDDDDTTPNNNNQTMSDTTFIRKAALANMAEIQLGQLASSNGDNDSVQSYGRVMVSEHQLAQNELSTLAVKKNVMMPSALDSMHQALKTRLSTLTGYAFDSLYISGQVTDHQKTKYDFEQEIASGKDQEVKNYATKYLPHINMHLEHAIHLKDSIDQVHAER